MRQILQEIPKRKFPTFLSTNPKFQPNIFLSTSFRQPVSRVGASGCSFKSGCVNLCLANYGAASVSGLHINRTCCPGYLSPEEIEKFCYGKPGLPVLPTPLSRPTAPLWPPLPPPRPQPTPPFVVIYNRETFLG